MISRTVLVADDEEEILDVMVKKVASEGYNVVRAVDGEDAWEKVKNSNPDIIVLDLNMPKMHGFEVLRLVRENPLVQRWQPVIIVSAQNELADIQKGYSLEADHYIAKPCTMTDIIKAIKLMENLIPQRVEDDK